MTKINNDTALKDLAGIISSTLTEAGIEAILVGGAAVSIYSDNVYQTYDLDFMTRYSEKAISDALEPLGFKRRGMERHWENPNTEFLIEFPGEDLSFGETDVSIESTATLSTPLGSVRVITPTQTIMDRLAAYIHWNDTQAYDQSVLIAQNNDIDWKELYEWVFNEGEDTSIIDDLHEKISKSQNLAAVGKECREVIDTLSQENLRIKREPSR